MPLIVQIVLIIFLLFPISRVFLRFKEGQLTPPFFVFWLTVWTTALVVLIFPSLTTKIARTVGINRGIDVVIYLSIALLFYLVFRIYVSLENMRKEISEIVRMISLKNVKRSRKRK